MNSIPYYIGRYFDYSVIIPLIPVNIPLNLIIKSDHSPILSLISIYIYTIILSHHYMSHFLIPLYPHVCSINPFQSFDLFS